MRYVFLAGLIAIGCGGSEAGESAATDSGSDTPFAVDAMPETPSPSTCSASPPVELTECTPNESSPVYCSYGDAVAPWCRTVMMCRLGPNSYWHSVGFDCTDPCPTAPPSPGSSCTRSALSACAWPDGTMCNCDRLPTGNAWRCDPPPSDKRCPRAAANAGSPCTTEGLECDYAIAADCLDCRGLGYLATCKSGVWTWL